MQPMTNTILFSNDEKRFVQLNYMFCWFALEFLVFFLWGVFFFCTCFVLVTKNVASKVKLLVVFYSQHIERGSCHVQLNDVTDVTIKVPM